MAWIRKYAKKSRGLNIMESDSCKKGRAKSSKVQNRMVQSRMSKLGSKVNQESLVSFTVPVTKSAKMLHDYVEKKVLTTEKMPLAEFLMQDKVDSGTDTEKQYHDFVDRYVKVMTK